MPNELGKIPVILTQRMLDRIEELGHLRFPNEACGILLPIPRSRQGGQISQVVEMPNRTTEPGKFIMSGEDVWVELESWLTQHSEHVDNLSVWHTHPGGNIGPSSGDMHERKNRPEVAHLVVALTQRGPVATWF